MHDKCKPITKVRIAFGKVSLFEVLLLKATLQSLRKSVTTEHHHPQICGSITLNDVDREHTCHLPSGTRAFLRNHKLRSRYLGAHCLCRSCLLSLDYSSSQSTVAATWMRLKAYFEGNEKSSLCRIVKTFFDVSKDSAALWQPISNINLTSSLLAATRRRLAKSDSLPRAGIAGGLASSSLPTSNPRYWSRKGL